MSPFRTHTYSILAITHETNTMLGLFGSDDLTHSVSARNQWAGTYIHSILPQSTFSGDTPSKNVFIVHVHNSTYLLLSIPHLSLA